MTRTHSGIHMTKKISLKLISYDRKKMIYVFLKILMWEFYELKLPIACYCKIIFVTLVLLKMPGSYPQYKLFMSIDAN